MFCPKCGSKVPDGSDTCQKCNTKLIVEAQATAQSQPQYTPENVSKKKPKKWLIILGVAFALILILIIANAGKLAERGEQAKRDEEYIKSKQQETVATGEQFYQFQSGVYSIAGTHTAT